MHGLESMRFRRLVIALAARQPAVHRRRFLLACAQVSLFLPERVKRVEDYLGCAWAPHALRLLEDRIDSIGGAEAWLATR